MLWLRGKYEGFNIGDISWGVVGIGRGDSLV